MRRLFAVLAAVILGVPQAAALGESVRLEHVVVSYEGVGKAYAEALGRTVAAARAIAVEQFGFNMPETVTLTVAVDPSGRPRLFNDGQDRISLTVRSEEDLRQPATSGVFNIYGMCHEVGHLAMYRLIKDQQWMTSAAAEGWAHYAGSRWVDGVRAKEGPDLWPDRYEYLNDGMKRLERQWAAGDAAGLIKGAGLWKDLIAIVGDKGIAPIFRAWGKAAVDPADPAESLRKVLLASGAREPTAAWLSRAKDAFLQKRPKSEFAAGTVEPNQLAGRPQELAHDDGQAAGKRSIAGSGHAVRFEAPGESSYLTAVRIHGSRYGQPAPPKEDFRVWLCDKDFKAIAEFQHPYAKFQWGKPQWVTLRVKPTRVPREFIVCVGFQPTATKGVFLSHDAGGEGNSLTGLPGAKATRFSQGDWLIRVSVDRLK